MSGHDIPAV